ncbi:MAG: CHASE2 domain-containing protein, partial [Calditrichaeota bacterium]|nr:CHASE2 domain-containing protein [Calditrichota bacterium]
MRLTRKQQHLIPLAAGFAVILIIASLNMKNQFRRFDLNAWDLCTQITCKWHKPDPRILMVGVNQESMDYFSSHGTLWPWPRDFWAHLISLAEKGGATGVIFDVLYDDPGINRLNSNARAADSIFAARLTGNFPTIIASILNPGEELLKNIPPQLLADDKEVPIYPLPNHKLILPHQKFRKANIGLTNVIADDDGVYRSVPLIYESAGKKLYTLGYKTATLIDDVNIDNLNLDEKNRYLLRYYGKGGPGGAFPYQAAGDLIMGNYPPDSLKGKILIVGGYAAGLMDYKPTPVADVNYPYPGFEIHATFISNLLQEDGLGHLPKAASFFITLLLGVLALAAFTLFKDIWQQAVGLLLITIFVLVLVLSLFNAGWLLSLVSPLLACFLSVGIYLYAGWRLEGRQRVILHNMFSRYLDQNVIESLIDNPEELGLIGINRKATILFTDMVGFTPMSENLSPEEVVSVLNDYHT